MISYIVWSKVLWFEGTEKYKTCTTEYSCRFCLQMHMDLLLLVYSINYCWTKRKMKNCRCSKYTTGNGWFAGSKKKFAGCFLSGTRQRNSLPGARPGGLRQSSLCRVPGTRQIPAVGKNGLCRVPATRQNMAAGKSGRRQPLPGATPLGTRQRIFLFFI